MKLDFLNNFDFFTGVPDSLLQPMCNWLVERYGVSGSNHIIAANEGNAVGLAAGYHLATGKVPVVYLQNSGVGNIINPVTSLLSPEVYGIPCLFIVGWRGEPDVHDEPQHAFMGKATLPLLEASGIETFVISRDTAPEEVSSTLGTWKQLFAEGKSAAFVVKKGAFQYDGQPEYSNNNSMLREEVIRRLLPAIGNGIVVSTTGKTSRELFELRETDKTGHERDFLTVGSMGHASSIALGIALAKPQKRVWVLDGDGAVLMHLGAMAVNGVRKPENLIHVAINNGAHESVGGLPTVGESIDLPLVAKACGYENVFTVNDESNLKAAIKSIEEASGSVFFEIHAAIGSRAELGRPTISAVDNKAAFMKSLGNV